MTNSRFESTERTTKSKSCCRRWPASPPPTFFRADHSPPQTLAGPVMTPSRDIGRLLEIMAALRTPGTGCPWDLA
ncbi:MAG: hypothetical protein WB774_15160, partial [Xanthobacteraceae bacterium]